MMTIRILILTLLPLLFTATAAGQKRATVAPESHLWIEGSSTVNRFMCEAGQISGEASLNGSQTDAFVVVQVETFDCGKSRMNRDFYDALKSDEHPRIVFELDDARLSAPEDEVYEVVVTGRLTIAGVTRSVSLVAEGRGNGDNGYRLTGRLPLSMTDFNVEPPTALAGLIKAHERIVVGFDLVADIDAAAATAGSAHSQQDAASGSDRVPRSATAAGTTALRGAVN